VPQPTTPPHVPIIVW